MSEHLLIFAPLLRRTYFPIPPLPAAFVWPTSFAGYNHHPLQAKLDTLSLCFKMLLHCYSPHLHHCVMIITVLKDVSSIGKSLVIKDLFVSIFIYFLTALNCLLGKNFTNITYISGNGGAGEYCTFSKLHVKNHQ